MQINKKFFPKILNDNEAVYFSVINGIIESVDELSSLEIVKVENSYRFRLAPSLPKYLPLLIEELLKFHNLLRIKLDMGKSIKTSSTIVFTINLDN
jgi:hypothetical protein